MGCTPSSPSKNKANKHKEEEIVAPQQTKCISDEEKIRYKIALHDLETTKKELADAKQVLSGYRIF